MRDLQITSNSCSAGRVAQSVEQRIENPRVDSSILSPATKFRKDAKADLQNLSWVILSLATRCTNSLKVGLNISKARYSLANHQYSTLSNQIPIESTP